MTNTLLKRFTMRRVGIFGAVLFSISNIAMAFVNHFYEMAFLNLLQGVGIGLIVTICNTNFNAYFVKKRAPVRKRGAGARYLPLFLIFHGNSYFPGNERGSSNHWFGFDRLSHTHRETDECVRIPWWVSEISVFSGALNQNVRTNERNNFMEKWKTYNTSRQLIIIVVP